jgi:hypothetical protein
MMSCVVCTMHKEMRSVGFLVEPQNQGRWFLGLDLKTGSSGLVIWTSKLPRRFFGLNIKTKRALICRLRHKTDRGSGARHASRSTDLICVEASLARVSSQA